MVVALVDDLMFSSKIQGACRVAGVELTFVRQADAALATVRAGGATLLILDLERDTLDPLRVIRDVKSASDLGALRIAAFVRHTNIDRIKAAREAGADLVLARSAFFPALPEILAGTYHAPASQP
jgi:CheY-like chemotaxis protein